MPDNDAIVTAPVAATVIAVPASPEPKNIMSTSTLNIDPVVPEPVAADSVAATTDPVIPAPVEQPKWFQRRFDEMTKTNRTLEREKEALIEQNAQLLAAAAAAKGGIAPLAVEPIRPVTPNVPIQSIDDLVNARVELMRFNTACDSIAADGKKEFADFDNAIGILNQVGLIDAPDKPQTFLKVATTLENPHKVMHYLGTNPDEAARLRTLDQVGLARELTKLEFKLNQPKNASVSNAPPPIKPISGIAKGEVDLLNDKNVSMDDWVDARRKQRAAKFAARRNR